MESPLYDHSYHPLLSLDKIPLLWCHINLQPARQVRVTYRSTTRTLPGALNRKYFVGKNRVASLKGIVCGWNTYRHGAGALIDACGGALDAWSQPNLTWELCGFTHVWWQGNFRMVFPLCPCLFLSIQPNITTD